LQVDLPVIADKRILSARLLIPNVLPRLAKPLTKLIEGCAETDERYR
jgi:hypothetical protein